MEDLTLTLLAALIILAYGVGVLVGCTLGYKSTENLEKEYERTQDEDAPRPPDQAGTPDPGAARCRRLRTKDTHEVYTEERMPTTPPTPTPLPCRHPAPRLSSWCTTDLRTGKRDWLCVGCTACGEVLAGSAEAYEAVLAQVSCATRQEAL